MPAAILIVVILGAMAVDSAITFVGQRELNAFTTSAADDVAARAIAPGPFYEDGRITIDARQAQDLVAVLASRPGSGLRNVHFSVDVDGPTVTVRATAVIASLFSVGVPGMPTTRAVQSSSTATARTVAPVGA
jgi:hypothetical protein